MPGAGSHWAHVDNRVSASFWGRNLHVPDKIDKVINMGGRERGSGGGRSWEASEGRGETREDGGEAGARNGGEERGRPVFGSYSPGKRKEEPKKEREKREGEKAGSGQQF